MTNKKLLYAEARLAGVPQKDAAIQAGYSAATADQAASRLERDPVVIATLKRMAVVDGVDPADMPVTGSGTPTVPADEPEPCILAPADDPLVFLKGVMNDLRADPKLRVDAAKSLASYIHAKPGEKGKKEQAEEHAKTAATGTGWADLLAPGVTPIRKAAN